MGAILSKKSRLAKFLPIIVLGLVVLVGAGFIYLEKTKIWPFGQKTENEEISSTEGQIPESSPQKKSEKSSPPKTSQEKIKEADELVQRGEYDRAVPLYEEVIKEDPFNISAYNSLASIYAKKGDKERALAVVNKGLENNPNNFSLLQTKDLIEYVWFNK